MKRLLYTLLISLLLVITIGLFGQSSNELIPNGKQMVKVMGTIKDAPDQTNITFRFYKDYISFEEIDFTDSITDEQFSLTIPIYASTPGFVIYNGQSVPIFVEAADDFSLSSQHQQFTDSLKYTSKGALRNNYLKSSFILFDKQDASLIEEGMSKKTSEGFVELMGQFKEKKQEYLHNYLASRDTFFSEDFQQYIDADINYWWGQSMFQYRDHHPASHILPVTLNLPDEFYDFVKNLELNNEEALNNTHYLKYLEYYTDWRQDRMEKGLLKIDTPSRKSKVAISRIETFAEVLMPNLEVREKAHDEASVFTTLSQKETALHLRDITNDKFRFYHNGSAYIGYFVKIQLADGRKGWVYERGIRMYEDEVTEYVTIDVPKGVEDYLHKLKYSRFRGKVLHYAVSNDIYNDIKTGKRVTQSDLDNYILHSPYGEYVQILQEAYAARKYSISPSSLRGTSDEQKVTEQINTFTKNLINLLEIAEQEQEKPSVKPKRKEAELSKKIESSDSQKDILIEKGTIPIPSPNVLVPTAAPKTVLKEVAVTPSNLAAYQQKTYLRFKTNFSSGDSPSIVFNQNPFINDLQERKLGTVSTGRSFITFSTNLASTSCWQLKNGQEVVDLYFKPGDDIKVEISGSDIYTQTTFTGSNSAENSYLLAHAAAFQYIEKELAQKIEFAEPTEFKAWMEDILQKRLTFFYDRMQGLNPSFLAYAEADINYWYAFNLMNYLYEHPMLNDEKFPMEAPEGYLDFMQNISIHNDAALPNRNYILYIHEYLAHLQRLPINKGKKREALVDIHLSGKTQDFLNVILLSIDATMPPRLAALSHKINKFESIALDPVYVEFVKKAFYNAKGLKEGMLAPDFTLVDQYGKTVRLSDFKGQIVLIDFWATWCSPCLGLMPTHRSLQEKYKGKNITFIYISMDNNTNIWKNYLGNKQLGGQHLISNEAMGFKSPVSKDYQIKYLPYTLLLDTDGTIVWKRKGGFSVSTATKTIDQLLGKW